jgi:hypothetical protein
VSILEVLRNFWRYQRWNSSGSPTHCFSCMIIGWKARPQVWTWNKLEGG